MLVDWLIRRAKRTPYTHIYGPDGSLYMERFWLVPYASYGARVLGWRNPLGKLLQRYGIGIRLHHIVREDLAPHLHDHPWSFVSVLLRGQYDEERPLHNAMANFDHDGIELNTMVSRRKSGSVAVRHTYDRHTITAVHGDVWTLFVTFRHRQAWGFFTPQGKRYWWDYQYVRDNYRHL